MYELHRAVGDILRSIELPGVRVLLDNACSGLKGQLALHFDTPPTNATCLAQPDAAFVLNDEIHIIAEIEKSDIRPVYLCGKVLATAISQYIRYEGQNFPICEKLLFVQVFEKTNEDENWSKYPQARYLKAQFEQGWQKCREGKFIYSMHYGTAEEFVSDLKHQLPLREEILEHLRT